MRIFYFIFLILLLLSCDKPLYQYKSYYFQYYNYESPMVHTYTNIENEKDKYHYIINSQIGTDRELIHIEVLNSTLAKIEDLLLRADDNGVFVEEFLLLVDDELQQMKVYSDTLFLWNINDGFKYKFESSKNRPEMFEQCVSKRVFTFEGDSEDILYNNANYKSIKISSIEYLDIGTGKGTAISKEYTFARGLGLYGIKITNNNKINKEYRLKKIELLKNFQQDAENTINLAMDL